MRNRPVIDNIDKLLSEMTPMLKMAGLKEKTISRQGISVEADHNELLDALTWITLIHSGAYKSALYAYRRHRPETWENFKAQGTKGLPEQILLNNALKELKREFMENRPLILFRAKAGHKGARRTATENSFRFSAT